MQRTGLTSARLVRVLAELGAEDLPEPKQTLGERIGQWLGFNDALSLYSAINADTTVTPPPGTPPMRDVVTLQNTLNRLRATLTASFTTASSAKPTKPRIEFPSQPAIAADGVPDFSPYHRYYLAHQRAMAADIGALRARARSALSSRSAALKRLALLDAVLEQGLAARERDLLAQIPEMLLRRCQDRYRTRQTAPTASSAIDASPDDARDEWPETLRKDIEELLQAELELRLQPVAGLIAALDEEGKRCQ